MDPCLGSTERHNPVIIIVLIRKQSLTFDYISVLSSETMSLGFYLPKCFLAFIFPLKRGRKARRGQELDKCSSRLGE